MDEVVCSDSAEETAPKDARFRPGESPTEAISALFAPTVAPSCVSVRYATLPTRHAWETVGAIISPSSGLAEYQTCVSQVARAAFSKSFLQPARALREVQQQASSSTVVSKQNEQKRPREVEGEFEEEERGDSLRWPSTKAGLVVSESIMDRADDIGQRRIAKKAKKTA